MKKILLLDLEETVIPEFGNFYIPDLWSACLSKFIREGRFDEVRIYSWAIYNNKDKALFESVSLPLSIELGTPFSYVYTVEEVIADVKQYCNIHLRDINDFFDFYNKERVLYDLSLNGWLPENTHITLLDDAVKEVTIEIERSKIEIINFKKLLSKN
jgi:uncharacterized ubiquitin-like protein YukD